MLQITFQTEELCVWQHLALFFAKLYTTPAALLFGMEAGPNQMAVQFLQLLVEQHSSLEDVVGDT